MSDKNNFNETPDESLGFGEDELDLGLSLDDIADENPLDMDPMDDVGGLFGGSNDEEDFGISLDDVISTDEPETEEFSFEEETEEDVFSAEEDEDTGYSFQEEPEIEDSEEYDENLMMDEPEGEISDVAIAGAAALSEYAKQQAQRIAEEEAEAAEKAAEAARKKAEQAKPKRAEERRTPRRSQVNPYKSNSSYAQYEKAKPQGGKKIVEMGQTSSSRTSRADMTVVGYGRISFFVKFIGFIVVLAAAFAVGFAVQYVAQFFDVKYMYAIKYLPLVNTAILLLYYLMFTVRSFNYRKKRDNNFKAPTPRNKKSVTYRKMNNGYYTIMRGLIWVIFTIVFDVCIIVGSNVVYGRLF